MKAIRLCLLKWSTAWLTTQLFKEGIARKIQKIFLHNSSFLCKQSCWRPDYFQTSLRYLLEILFRYRKKLLWKLSPDVVSCLMISRFILFLDLRLSILTQSYLSGENFLGNLSSQTFWDVFTRGATLLVLCISFIIVFYVRFPSTSSNNNYIHWLTS